MIRPGWVAAGLLATAIAVGTLSNPPIRKRALMQIGGYQVLAADFHIHTYPLNWTTLAPWDVLLESQRQHLDVVAVVGHNHVWVSQWAHWLSERSAGPIVLVSEEIASPRYHIIAAGIKENVSWQQPAAAAIAEVHRQGGVAIAAHPEAEYWAGFDAAAMRELDAAEVLHPDAYFSKKLYAEMRRFYQRKRVTAIGSSDFHGLQYPGICRTYVFVRERSEAGVLEALRAGRTIVYDRDGRSYGDPVLIASAAHDGRLPEPDDSGMGANPLALFSKIAGLAGLAMALSLRSR